MKKYFFFIQKNYIEFVLIIFSLIFSSWLMFSTFSYSDGSIIIASKAWSDFASHLPLIRSFSFGNNFPPEYPIFSGEPIRYHFLFYFFVGLFEKIGLRIDLALNMLSASAFFGLILVIYFLAKKLFQSKTVGILSVVFFIFNGSLSFIEFFKTYSISTNILNEIFNNSSFPSFGPYDGKIVSAFWNLNIYTNQRHFALPLMFLLLLIYFLISRMPKNKLDLKLDLIFGFLIGVLPFLNSSIYITTYCVLGVLFFLLKIQRKNILIILLIGFLVSFPKIISLGQTIDYKPHLQIGYLIANGLNIKNFIYYWFLNLGLSFILIPIGFILSSNFQKKILISFFSLFLIGNLIQFSPEIAANHKFFNVFIIIGNMFSAFVIYKLWKFRKLKILIPILVFFMIFSGIIDFFPIKNDRFVNILDYPKNTNIKWIVENTSKDTVFLNSSYLYNPASLAGRKIFLGWPYFSWSLGYDTNKRGSIRDKILQETDKKTACELLKKNNLNFIEVRNDPNSIKPSNLYFEKFYLAYSNKLENYYIYDISKSCSDF